MLSLGVLSAAKLAQNDEHETHESGIRRLPVGLR